MCEVKNVLPCEGCVHSETCKFVDDTTQLQNKVNAISYIPKNVTSITIGCKSRMARDSIMIR